MPANTFSGVRLLTVSVAALAAYAVGRTDGLVELSAIPAGGTTVTLPSQPSEGDFYLVADADGSCSGAKPMIIAAAAGDTISGAASTSFSTARSAAIVMFDASADTWIVFSGQTSSAGGGSLTIVKDFTFATASPLVLCPMTAGGSILRSQVEIKTSFDGFGANLLLGTTASTSAIFALGDLDLTSLGVGVTFTSDQLFEAPGATSVVLTLAPGASTQGAGTVAVTVQL